MFSEKMSKIFLPYIKEWSIEKNCPRAYNIENLGNTKYFCAFAKDEE